MSAAPTTSYERIAFVASPIPEAQDALDALRERYGNVRRQAPTSSSRSAATA